MSVHRRSSSKSSGDYSLGSPLPSQTHHSNLLPHVLPAPALVESVAGGAHYSGGGRQQAFEDLSQSSNTRGSIELKKRRSSSDSPSNHRNSHHRGHSGTWGEEKDKLSEKRKQILADLKELYACRPGEEIFERSWRRDAIFEDPLCFARGYDEYTAQWYTLPKMFSASQTLRSRVMSSTQLPNRLVYAQTQEYTYRWLGKKKKIESIIVLDLDQDDKIMRLSDQWSGGNLPERFGADRLRKANGKLMPWFIKNPKHNSRSL